MTDNIHTNPGEQPRSPAEGQDFDIVVIKRQITHPEHRKFAIEMTDEGSNIRCAISVVGNKTVRCLVSGEAAERLRNPLVTTEQLEQVRNLLWDKTTAWVDIPEPLRRAIIASLEGERMAQIYEMLSEDAMQRHVHMAGVNPNMFDVRRRSVRETSQVLTEQTKIALEDMARNMFLRKEENIPHIGKLLSSANPLLTYIGLRINRFIRLDILHQKQLIDICLTPPHGKNDLWTQEWAPVLARTAYASLLPENRRPAAASLPAGMLSETGSPYVRPGDLHKYRAGRPSPITLQTRDDGLQAK